MPLNFDDLVPAAPANSGANNSVQRKAVSFDDLIPAQPSSGIEPAGGDPESFHRFGVLPIGKDLKTGEYSAAVPRMITAIPDVLEGMYEGAKSAVTLPGRVYRGEVQMNDADGRVSQDLIGEALNFAMFGTPASPGGPLFVKGAAAAAPKPVPPPVLKPGQEAALAADRLGVDLPRAAASDLTTVQQTGKFLTNIPFGGNPLRNASKQAINQLDDAALKAQRGYGAGDVAAAGASVRQGIKDFSENTLDDLVSKKYDVVDNLVKPDIASPLSATAKAVANIRARRGAAALPEDGVASGIVSDAIKRDGLTYQGIKDLRSTIGSYIKKPQLAPAGADQGELKAIYASLSDDLRGAVKAAGGDKAVSAFEEANSFAAKTATEQKALDKIIGPQSDEGLFSKIQSMAGSTSTADIQNLMRVRRSVSPETWNEMSSAVISKMGRDADGKFSPERFLTAYGKLSPNGKNLLFKTSGKDDLASSLDDIATVSRRFKQLNEFSNPSGTGQAASGVGYFAGLFLEPTTVVSSLVGSRALSSVLSKPTTAKAMAKWTQAYEQAAKAPSKEASINLGARARVLALAIANDNGAPAAYNQISTALSRLRNVKAEPGDEHLRENDQQERERQQLRALELMNPNET
ncbi:putative injection protein [Rhizobium phage RHph_Y1_10]|nr:putative injection protein [Rhizobium phage RHph_Y1_10]